MSHTVVYLPQPCAESWDAMTPTGPGRHCAACQQVVVDFTTFTDGELAAYFQQHAQPPCGRFRESQLSRPLLPAAAPVAGWRRWLGAAVALLGLGSLAAPARAQSSPARPTTVRPAGTALRPVQTVRPAAAKVTCAPSSAALPERQLLGEPVLAGAPQLLMGRPAPPPAKSKSKPTKR